MLGSTLRLIGTMESTSTLETRLMEWWLDNLVPLLSALVPLLSLAVPPAVTSRPDRNTLRLRRYAEIRSLLPGESEAWAKLDELISREVDAVVASVESKAGRSVDGVNLFSMIVVSAIGGAIVFGGSLWAQSLTGLWAIVLWVLVTVVAISFLLLVGIGGISSFYKYEQK